MSLIDGLMSKITGCFTSRRDDGLVNIIQNKNIGYFETYPSDTIGAFNLISDNNHVFNFKRIYDYFTNDGIPAYKVNSFSYKNKVKLVNLKFDFEKNCFIIIFNNDNKESYLKLEDLIEVLYGNSASNFILISSKLDITPWRCISLVDKFYETYDFIFESDEETFYILTLIKVLNDSENKEKIRCGNTRIKITDIIAKLYWKKVFLKIRFSKNNK
jgi:hypothetical protein